MKNRSFTLLALLAASDRLGEPAVHRTTLVKQAFLAETIRPLYRIWIKTFEFVRYKHGPWSDHIFDLLDPFIFGGFVEVTKAERRSGRFQACYRITDAGHSLLERFEAPDIKELAMDLIWALQSLGIEQSNTICKLVYQEAEFARIFASQEEKGIGPEARVCLPAITDAGNETFMILSVLQELTHKPGIGPSTEQVLPSREVVRLFLQLLATRIPRQSTKLGANA
jgi:hypothetical protein